MNKEEIIIICHVGIGKTCLTEAIEMQLGKNVKVTEVSISEMLGKEKPLAITNPRLKDADEIFFTKKHKSKDKKPYWHKGKLKYK